MQLVTCQYQNDECLAICAEGTIIIPKQIDDTLPSRMDELLAGGPALLDKLIQFDQLAQQGEYDAYRIALADVELRAPVPRPSSFRDAYAFRQHVATSRQNRGLDMIPEFDDFPVFYFSNHQAIVGPGEVTCMPAHFEQMDFELEVAVVINKRGKNIPASEADDYIAGYMIMNDLSARRLQMDEMKLNLGPAKGKDFATAIGPYLVTKDQLQRYKVNPPSGHTGAVYDLEMVCRVNDIEVSRGNLRDMHWTFAEIIERVSYGVDIFPGDIIGSGTVGTGCFLELNGTGRRSGIPDFQEQWLQPGDKISMSVTALGTLDNQILLNHTS